VVAQNGDQLMVVVTRTVELKQAIYSRAAESYVRHDAPAESLFFRNVGGDRHVI
jgi:hypothetical protein